MAISCILILDQWKQNTELKCRDGQFSSVLRSNITQWIKLLNKLTFRQTNKARENIQVRYVYTKIEI